MITRRRSLTYIASGLAAARFARLNPAQAQDLNVLSQGTFTGDSGHVTSGSVALTEKNGKHYISLGSDFSFDGAPDPKVALGNNGYDATTLAGPLQNNSGAQSYPLPDGFDVAEYNEVWIWCEKYNVPLGSAKLN